MGLKRGKKAQLTIFIILGLLILIVLILLFMRNDDLKSYFVGSSPVEEIKNCVEKPVEEMLDIVRFQGGSIDPENYYLYEDNKLEYLCYTDEEYKTCVVQKPLLKNSIEEELRAYAQPRIKNCIESVRNSLRDQGYEVSMKNPELVVELFPSDVMAEVDLDLSIKKGDTTETYKKIRVEIDSMMYDFVMISTSIVQWETRYGDSEVMNYMLYYPEIKVEKKKQGDGTTVYMVSNWDSKEMFMFAVKSYVVPAGLI
jgi:hypothetical protein